MAAMAAMGLRLRLASIACTAMAAKPTCQRLASIACTAMAATATCLRLASIAWPRLSVGARFCDRPQTFALIVCSAFFRIDSLYAYRNLACERPRWPRWDYEACIPTCIKLARCLARRFFRLIDYLYAYRNLACERPRWPRWPRWDCETDLPATCLDCLYRDGRDCDLPATCLDCLAAIVCTD